VEKYGKGRQVTGENTMLRGKDALRMPPDNKDTRI
jgi:hypothetical protein